MLCQPPMADDGWSVTVAGSVLWSCLDRRGLAALVTA